MAGKVSFRLTPETRKLLPDHADFYAPILDLYKNGDSPLVLKARDAEARSEAEIKPNGDIEVTFVIPLDDNEKVEDGRVYLRDKFLFDPTQKVLKSYKRSFELGGQGSLATWQGWLGKYEALLQSPWKLNDSRVQRFGLSVARTYGQAVVDEQEKTLAKLRTAFGREHRYLDSADALIKEQGQRSGIEDLRLRIKESKNLYQVIRKDGEALEVIFNFAVDTDGQPENGRIWLKDRFLLEAGKMQGFTREWTLDPNAQGNEKYGALLENLKRQPEPDSAEVKAFIENLYPDLVPQGNPHPNDLMPLLAASVKAPSGTSAFKGRGKGGAEILAAQGEVLPLLHGLAKEESAKRADGAEGLLSFSGKVDVLSEQRNIDGLFAKLKVAQEKGSAASLKSLLEGLELSEGESEQRQKLLRLTAFSELNSLAEEKDPELRREGLLHLADGRLFSDQAYPGTALAIAELLSEAPKIQGKAQKLVDLAQGRGAFGSKVEFILGHFHQELTKPSMLVGMMAAPFAGVALETGGLRLAKHLHDLGKIQKIGSGIKLGAAGAGMFGEALAFTGVHRSYERLWHGSDRAWKDAHKEVASSFLLFAGMRATHAGSAWTGSRMAEGKLNFSLKGREIYFGGRAGAASHSPTLAVATPTGRLLMSSPWIPEAGLGAPALSRLGGLSTGLMNHLGSIGAMRAASWLSAELGLAPVSTQGFGANFFDSAVAYLQAILGFKLANWISRGRLQPSLGEAKMRLGAFEPTSLTQPKSWAARRGMFKPTIPELRLFDLHQNDLMTDFRVHQGQEISLDNIFFGNDLRRITVGIEANGLYVIDRRAEAGNPTFNSNHRQFISLGDQNLLLNRQVLPKGIKTALHEGDSLFFPSRNLRVTRPKDSEIFTLLSDLSPREQLKLSARIEAETDFEGVVAAVHRGGPDLKQLAAHLRAVWEGRELLHTLPIELDLLGKVRALMEAELKVGEREGLDELAVTVKPAFSNTRWSPLERSVHINRAIQELQAQLRGETSIHDLSRILKNSPFLQIEGKPIHEITRAMNEVAVSQRGSIQDLPYTAGIRQRVRDILERDLYWAAIRLRQDGKAPRPSDPTMQADYQKIFGDMQAIYEQVKTSAAMRKEAPEYTPEKLEELVYQVLERGKPLEILPSADGLRGRVSLYQYQAVQCAEKLFPVEMNVKVDPWTGERIDPMNREARYRLALHVLNIGVRRPVLGIPSPVERQELVRLVDDYLDHRVGRDFLKAQGILRDHFDRATPEAQSLLRKAKPEEKALLLSLYFGAFQRRDLAPSTALQVGTWMGQAGMFREVGVTYEISHDSLRPTLSLGNLSNVEPQHRDDFFLFHTHPEGYVNADGGMMGYESRGAVHTINLADARISRSTLNILPSQVDLRLFFQKSQDYWRMGNPLKFGETPLFKVEGNRFRNWVVHSLGLSQVQVPLDAQGRPTSIEVQFAARRFARLLNGEYQKQKQALEAMSTEFGIPVVVTETDYAGLMSEMPYGIRSLFDAAP